MNRTPPATETRTERKKRRNREALILAAYGLVAEKGIDATTMQDITERADVGLGTAYNYFGSKDELVTAAIEQGMDRLARRIEMVTDTFDDPAQVYAYGWRTVMETATTDRRWRWLMQRSEVTADAIFRCFGPYAMRDLQQARAAGRYVFDDVELVWRQATWAAVGLCRAIGDGTVSDDRLTEAVVNLLGMVGVARAEAWEIASRPRPPLPDD
jgi:AcrR family transcriptional regulator